VSFAPYDRPLDFQWLAIVAADTPELSVVLGLAFADEPLPAAYPFPSLPAVNNAGTVADAPLDRAFLQINTGDTLPAAAALPSGAAYTLELLTEAAAGLLTETPVNVALCTEAGAPLCTEAGVDLACAGKTSSAGAPLCTEAGKLRGAAGLWQFVAAQDYYLIRAEVPQWEDGAAGWLDVLDLTYVPAANVQSYASQRVALWQEAAAADVQTLEYHLQALSAARTELEAIVL